MDERKKGEIEKLNDTLYSRTKYQDPLDKRTPIKKVDIPDVSEGWQTPDLDQMLKHERVVKDVHPLMKKVFIFALLFFIATVITAGFVFIGGANFVSSKNVDINVLGPTTISAGEVFELGVSISNTNNADLEFANLSIQYPEGSRDSSNTAESLTYSSNDLGVIKAGAETVSNINLALLGSAGETKEIKFSVEYKVKGSNATFYKDKIFEIVIGDASVLLEVASPSSVISGDSFTTDVTVTLKSRDILKNVILRAEYPYGYGVLSATPEAVADDNVWILGDMSPEDKKKISIKGRLIGEDNEQRTFRFYVGVSDGGSANHNLKITMNSLLNTLTINRPFIDLNISFNGENVPVYVAPVARVVATTIRFQNNFSDKLLNPRLEVSLSGASLDRQSVSTAGAGFYDPQNAKVVWNLTNSLGNPELSPGESGQVSLRFSSLPSVSLPSGSRDIVLNFSISGIPVGTVGQKPIVVSGSRTVKISSQVNFSSKVLHSLGSFSNTGPIPPKVGKDTTYTAVLSIGNTQGNINEAKVTANLGQGVSWLGASSFTSEDISYDSTSNILTWNIGTLNSDTGFSTAPRELSFQVSLNPSIGQIGTAPTLVTGIVFSGRDAASGNVITVNNSPLTTNLPSDPAFIQGDDIVVK